jgi:hypothetical protein
MSRFTPDYRNVVYAALNREAERLSRYEHGFDFTVTEAVREWRGE